VDLGTQWFLLLITILPEYDQNVAIYTFKVCNSSFNLKKLQSKAVPLHAMVALGGRGGIVPAHS
jgi:hypothetical protein